MRRLGESGLFVSQMCFGAMTFGGKDGLWGQVGRLGQDDANALVKSAIDLGINFIDTANTYADGRSEEILGKSLKDIGIARDDVVIATKVAAPMGEGLNARGASRRHILSQCRASLRRLDLDHVDLYQIHEFDRATPIEETLDALDTLVRAGDVRYVGLSNWAAWQVTKALGIGKARDTAPVICLQAYYSVVGRDLEREIVPMLLSEGLGLLVWSPLAGGYLSGKYAEGGQGGRRTELQFPPIDLKRGDAIVPVLQQIARKHQGTPAQVAIAWLLAQRSVTSVIVGAKRVEQLQENVAATQLNLDADDLSALDGVSSLPIEYPGWLLDRPSERNP